MKVPKRISERMVAALKSLRPVVEQQSARDISEADTVTLVKDLLAQVFGYDKYKELTGEHAIRSTYCDIAIEQKGSIAIIVEVKAINTALDDRHVKQSVDYAANQGADWVILTNARVWRLYKVIFDKPIDKHLVVECDITESNTAKNLNMSHLYLFTKEAYVKDVLADAHDRQMALSRHMIAALLVHNDRVVNTIRRELRRVVDVNVTAEEVCQLLMDEVIKRDAISGAPAEEAAKVVNKREDRKLRKRCESAETTTPPGPAADATVTP